MEDNSPIEMNIMHAAHPIKVSEVYAHLIRVLKNEEYKKTD